MGLGAGIAHRDGHGLGHVLDGEPARHPVDALAGRGDGRAGEGHLRKGGRVEEIRRAQVLVPGGHARIHAVRGQGELHMAFGWGLGRDVDAARDRVATAGDGADDVANPEGGRGMGRVQGFAVHGGAGFLGQGRQGQDADKSQQGKGKKMMTAHGVSPDRVSAAEDREILRG